jgi:uncharacterized protein (TIGR00369 family)
MSEAGLRAKLAEHIKAPPFHQFLDLELVDLDGEAGTVTLRMPFRPEFRRSPKSRQIHGGVIGALIDIAGDYALASKLGGGVPTIDLRIDFLRPAEDTALLATARVVRQGRTIGIVDIEVSDESGRLIAVGRGCYSTKIG